MYRAAIYYKGGYLAPGSDAFKMHQEKKFAELDKHLAELDKAWKKLEGR